MFLFSAIAVAISSYLIVPVINKKNRNIDSFLCFLLIAFSQIVLSFEILSLFKSISANGILICNIIFFITSLLLFIKTKSKIYIPNIKDEICKIKQALKTDKTLLFLSVCFVIFLFSQLIVALFFPVTFGDALTYYLPRCTSWIQNGSISHYITPDTRELIMPVNMEFLYTWLLLFTKNETGCGIFAYIGYFGTIYAMWGLLKELSFTVKRRLWSIFVFSSFALVAIEMYTPSADLFIGGLILCGIYLFLKSAKENNKICLYFSSLSFALAAGTKTTAVIAIPSVFLILLTITYLYKRECIKKYISNFILLFLANFLVFSSYNYILNIIQFSNPISCNEQMLLNQFRGGFKGWLCNLIKYGFSIFDTSGLKDFINFNGFISYLQSLTLGLIGETDKSYTSAYFKRYFEFNSQMSITQCALGIMGLFAFLPSLIKSVKLYLKNKLSKRRTIMAALALSLIFNILLFARVMVFTQFNMRYLLTFAVIASPIISYSYIKRTKFYKLLLCLFMFVYLVVIAHKMPVAFINSYIKYKTQNPEIGTSFLSIKSDETDIYNYIISQNDKNIALIASQVNTPNYLIEKIRLHGYKTDKLLLENIEEYNLEKYDFIITNKEMSSSTNIIRFYERINYPEAFVNQCIYTDYKQAYIYDTNVKPAMVNCEVPFAYFLQKGFSQINSIYLEKYIILTKSHTEV